MKTLIGDHLRHLGFSEEVIFDSAVLPALHEKMVEYLAKMPRYTEWPQNRHTFCTP